MISMIRIPNCAEKNPNAQNAETKYPPVLFPVYYSSEMYDATAYALNVLACEVFKEKLPFLPQEARNALIYTASWENEKFR